MARRVCESFAVEYAYPGFLTEIDGHRHISSALGIKPAGLGSSTRLIVVVIALVANIRVA